MDAREAYRLLELEPGADADALRAAFRAKARAHHPDARPDDPGAADTFRQIREAYQTLRSLPRANSRPPHRPSDRPTHHQGERPTDPGAWRTSDLPEDWARARAKDVFERFRQKREEARYGSTPFGRGSPSEDGERALMYVPFEAAIVGGEHVLSVDFGHGPTKLRVTLPAGVEDDQRFRVDARMVRARVLPHPHLRREGGDVLLDLPLSLTELVQGGRVRVPTPQGFVELQIPRGARPGQKLRLKGRGVGGQGDQLCTLTLATLPTGAVAENLYVALDALREGAVRAWDGPDEP